MTWRDRIDDLLGRRKQTLLLAAVIAGTGLLAFMAWARSAPATVAPPSTVALSTPADGLGSSPTAVSGPSDVILVHVAGAVVRPGLYEFPPDARVADAVDAARGARRSADLDALNLAEPLTDGVQIYVPRRGEAPPTVASGTASQAEGSTTSTAPINLNTADQTALETIPDVGPVTATAILEYRAEVGSFTSIDQLLEISGIGPATLESIRPYVTL